MTNSISHVLNVFFLNCYIDSSFFLCFHKLGVNNFLLDLVPNRITWTLVASNPILNVFRKFFTKRFSSSKFALVRLPEVSRRKKISGFSPCSCILNLRSSSFDLVRKSWVKQGTRMKRKVTVNTSSFFAAMFPADKSDKRVFKSRDSSVVRVFEYCTWILRLPRIK